MSKKARRRPSWKKDNFVLSKKWRWSTENGYLMLWPKCVEKELVEILYEKVTMDGNNNPDRVL